MDDISIVKPDDINALTFEDGLDLCTLITCTPYGVNSHRLLVRGHRIEKEEASLARLSTNATRINHWVVVAAILAPFVLIALLVCIIRRKR